MTALEVETSTVAAETGESKKNEVNGPMSGLQANDIHGDVTMVDARPTKADLVTLWLNADEIADLKEQFVPNTQFDRACTILRDSPVVVLCGIGTGRTFTGRKLLLHHGHSQIAHLNGSRGWDRSRRRNCGTVPDISGGRAKLVQRRSREVTWNRSRMSCARLTAGW
ncbi:hypothetical protein [Kibdelosporangium philippinense]|uniref:hypothetical protein n=1 Tax=Kibdelosporangium philippinense TaxID=211113 RepID=UPI0036092CAB